MNKIRFSVGKFSFPVFLQPTVPREQQLLFELMGDLQTFLRPLAAKFITTASDLTGRRLCYTKQRFIEK
jgi:hypothetical protein